MSTVPQRGLGQQSLGPGGCCAQKLLTILSTGIAHGELEGHYLDLLLWGLVVFLILLLISKKYMFLMFQVSMAWGQPADPDPCVLPTGLPGPRPVTARALWPAPCSRRLAPCSGPRPPLAHVLPEWKTLHCCPPLAGKTQVSHPRCTHVRAMPPGVPSPGQHTRTSHMVTTHPLMQLSTLPSGCLRSLGP